MLWTEVKSWAKKNGYTSFREKIDGSSNRYDYYWAKEDDPAVTGLSSSVSKLATDIYNHITNNQYIDYQQKFLEDQEDPTFSVSDYAN